MLLLKVSSRKTDPEAIVVHQVFDEYDNLSDKENISPWRLRL